MAGIGGDGSYKSNLFSFCLCLPSHIPPFPEGNKTIVAVLWVCSSVSLSRVLHEMGRKVSTEQPELSLLWVAMGSGTLRRRGNKVLQPFVIQMVGGW